MCLFCHRIFFLIYFWREPENCRNFAREQNCAIFANICIIYAFLRKIPLQFFSSPFAAFSSMLHGQFKWIQWEYLTFFFLSQFRVNLRENQQEVFIFSFSLCLCLFEFVCVSEFPLEKLSGEVVSWFSIIQEENFEISTCRRYFQLIYESFFKFFEQQNKEILNFHKKTCKGLILKKFFQSSIEAEKTQSWKIEIINQPQKRFIGKRLSTPSTKHS